MTGVPDSVGREGGDVARPDKIVGADVILVVALAVAVRLLFVVLFPAGGGDWDIYSTVADNILRGCGVSLSPVDGMACVPHFGGNHLPGFPAFVALVWSMSAHSDMAVRLGQVVLYAAALARLMIVLGRFAGSNKIALIVGLVMAFSPLQIAWPRYTQTETLTLAAVIWFFSELLASFAEGRFRAVPLGLAITAATFIRLDGIILCIPAAVAGFVLHSPMEAIRRGGIAALIVAAPIAGWTARNIAVGISPWPESLVMPEGAAAPHGYIQWGSTWVSEEYQRMGWAWPVNRFVYKSIVIDRKAFDSSEEKERVTAWLAELATYDGKPFPASIDARFAELAKERATRAPFRTYVVLPGKRAVALWRNPFSSFGWPNELPAIVGHQQRLEASRGFGDMLELARQYPIRATTKALTAGYRFILLSVFVLIVVSSFNRRLAPIRPFLWTVIIWIVVRTLFFAITNNVETRYTAPMTPAIELVAVLGVVSLLSRRSLQARG